MRASRERRPVPGAMVAPSIVGVTPNVGVGAGGSLQVVVSSAAGYTDVAAVEVVINAGFSGTQACHLRYDRAAHRFWLVNDAGTQFTGPATPGTSAVLANSQCSVNASGATAAGAGNTLTVTAPLMFAGAFAGSRKAEILYGVETLPPGKRRLPMPASSRHAMRPDAPSRRLTP